MKVCVLSSGSKGNSTYVEVNNHKILIDIGNSSLYIETALKKIDVDPKDIELILITHSHVDHINGLKVFCKKYNPKVYISNIILDELNFSFEKFNILDDLTSLKEIKIEDFNLSHDVNEVKGYCISDCNSSMVYITDTGYISEKYFDVLSNKSLYVFESNHDVSMLMNNEKYPHHTKIRILSDKGHLSNESSAYYLSKLIGNNTKHVILAHLSEQNNTEQLAFDTLINTLEKKKKLIPNIVIAKQNVITDLFDI